MIEAWLWLGVALLFLTGLAGIFVPFLPGIAFVFGGILLYAAVTGFSHISVTTVVVLGIVAIAAGILDIYGSAIGAKIGGGKKKAIIGSLVGAVVGLLLGPGGLLVGAMVGAIVGAWQEGNDWQKSVRIAMWSLAGALAVTAVQFVIALAMIVSFLLAIFW